jgi:ribose-phosphate pyrophosphokinase
MSNFLNRNDVRFFSGRSNPELAGGIAAYLSVPLDKTHFSRFSNDNLEVQLGKSVRGRDVFIVQSLVPPVSDNLVELLMMLDIARAAAAREVHAIIPYFSYARSDKKDAPRISIAARLIADLLQTAGATQVMTMTLHSPQVHGFFSVPTDPLTARGLFSEHVQKAGLCTGGAIVIAPDAGGSKSAAQFAERIQLPLAVANKTRMSDTSVVINELLGRQVEGFEHAIIYDDEIATGGSVYELSHILVKSGITQITVICTHGLFLGHALERLSSIPQICRIITTDTVPIPPEKRLPNMTILSVAPVFGEAIRRNYFRQSLGDLFTFGEDIAEDIWETTQEDH